MKVPLTKAHHTLRDTKKDVSCRVDTSRALFVKGAGHRADNYAAEGKECVVAIRA